MVTAAVVASAFRWQTTLETGACGTIEEIAAAEKINASYVSRILRLTLLAPEIVEAILDGRQPIEMTLAVVMRPFPVSWSDQQLLIAAAHASCRRHQRGSIRCRPSASM